MSLEIDNTIIKPLPTYNQIQYIPILNLYILPIPPFNYIEPNNRNDGKEKEISPKTDSESSIEGKLQMIFSTLKPHTKKNIQNDQKITKTRIHK